MMDEIDNEDETILVGSLDDIGRAAAKMENNDGDDQVKVTLFVEGFDDQKFWYDQVDKTKCTVEQSGGKKHVIVNVEKFSEEKKVALGIVDDDFDSLEGKTLDLPNLIATETHDLECLLLHSKAFDKVLKKYGNEEKIEQFKQVENKEPREALLERGKIFGQLRWLSHRHEWRVKFKTEKHKKTFAGEFMNNENWQVEQEKLLNNIVDKVNMKPENSLTTEQLQNLIDLLPQDADLWQVCQGHDLLYIFAIALQKVWGPKAVGVGSIASVLREEIESTEFLATELAKKIKNWECDNQPYQILRAYN
jgi:hypothetical protein